MHTNKTIQDILQLDSDFQDEKQALVQKSQKQIENKKSELSTQIEQLQLQKQQLVKKSTAQQKSAGVAESVITKEQQKIEQTFAKNQPSLEAVATTLLEK